jgi:hypothetical protein
MPPLETRDQPAPGLLSRTSTQADHLTKILVAWTLFTPFIPHTPSIMSSRTPPAPSAVLTVHYEIGCVTNPAAPLPITVVVKR